MKKPPFFKLIFDPAKGIIKVQDASATMKGDAVMNDVSATGAYYTLGHLVQFTGLSDRTLRNYLASGVLEGEKINGVWHFTPEQANALFTHPVARPAILAKKHSIIYDFLLNEHKTEPAVCITLDLPQLENQQIIRYFNDAFNDGHIHNIRFSFDGAGKIPRVILEGDPQQVMNLASGVLALPRA